MFCPHCSHSNDADATTCTHCRQDVSYFRERLFIGRQFVFVRASDQYPLALQVDGTIQTCRQPTIYARHHHALAFGDTKSSSEQPSQRPGLINRIRGRQPTPSRYPLPDQPQLPTPSLTLLTLVTDRKVYQPHSEATLFIIAPDAAGQRINLEIKMAGQKVYETKVTLNQEGLALHPYDDLKEGEFTATVRLADNTQADCSFSVAEFTLSPLIATLSQHAFAANRLSFTLNLLLLSTPYTGTAELGLQCGVCGDRVVATQTVEAAAGTAQGEFDISSHGGPFHVQITTPDGHTASIAFPGTGATERRRIPINKLGQTAEMGLLPWDTAQPIRGVYIGPDQVNMTPLMLERVQASSGQLKAAADIALAQVVTFDPRHQTSQTHQYTHLQRGQTITFDTDAPYTLFTVAAFLANDKKEPFEGWGIVIKPLAFTATLQAPATAQPGEEIDVYIEIPATTPNTPPSPAFCWLLVYDARLEHESPLPKLGKRIYESVRNATGNLGASPLPDALKMQPEVPDDFVGGATFGVTRSSMAMAMPAAPKASPRLRAMSFMAETAVDALAPQSAMDDEAITDIATMVMVPTRMEFPELAYQELFHFAGKAARTIRLGDQIGTWRVRAYVIQGVDVQELTADLQASKSLYAELDLPAIASEGDAIEAAVNYVTAAPAELIIATAAGETHTQVQGQGQTRFMVTGPGRIDVSLQNDTAQDVSSRFVARPGVQKVTASRLRILDAGQTAVGEQVVVYTSVGQVLKETITALTDYPFG